MASAQLPPQNLDAEELVLGALMLNQRVIGPVIETGLRADDFYRQSHGVVYRGILDLDAQGGNIDPVTVADHLDGQRTTDGKRSLLDEAGGTERIHELAALVPSASNAAHYARIVHEQSKLRGLIRVGQELVRMGYERPDEVPALIDQAETLLFEVAADADHGKVEQVRDVLVEQWQWMKQLSERNGELVGVTSGLPALDKQTTGWQPGNLIVLAARPSMGKTALAVNMGTAAAKTGTGVVLFSLEMSKKEIAQRLISAEARVPSNNMRSGTFSGDEWKRMTDACGALAPLPLFIDPSSQITVTEIRSKARRWKAKHPEIGLIVIDYLQLIDRQQRPNENDAAAVGRVSRALKVLAGELDVAVMVLSQLNRAVEQRADPIPRLSDLRDSGAIEQDADVVLFVYRPDYYDPNDRAGEADLIIGKQRNGPLDTVKLMFVSRLSKFTDPSTGGTP
jgi:replicative DNA helicase